MGKRGYILSHVVERSHEARIDTLPHKISNHKKCKLWASARGSQGHRAVTDESGAEKAERARRPSRALPPGRRMQPMADPISGGFASHAAATVGETVAMATTEWRAPLAESGSDQRIPGAK